MGLLLGFRKFILWRFARTYWMALLRWWMIRRGDGRKDLRLLWRFRDGFMARSFHDFRENIKAVVKNGAYFFVHLLWRRNMAPEQRLGGYLITLSFIRCCFHKSTSLNFWQSYLLIGLNFNLFWTSLFLHLFLKCFVIYHDLLQFLNFLWLWLVILL